MLPLSARDKTIDDHGLVSLLKQMHDEIDAAVLEAYCLFLCAKAGGNPAMDRVQSKIPVCRA